MSLRAPLAAEAEARIRILIVDDADEVRRDLSMVLQLAPDLEIVAEAVNGIEAVALADRLRPDIVLMDLRLPGLDGFEATEQIRKRGLAKGVIMLTIYDEPKNRARAERAGVDLFLAKGVDIGILAAGIRQVGESCMEKRNRPTEEGELRDHDGAL